MLKDGLDKAVEDRQGPPSVEQLDAALLIERLQGMVSFLTRANLCQDARTVSAALNYIEHAEAKDRIRYKGYKND